MSTKKLQILDYTIKQAENADTLDGKHASDFTSAPTDVSDDYDVWTPEDDDKSVAAFANTLDDGSYYCSYHLSAKNNIDNWFDVYSYTVRGVTSKYVFLRSAAGVDATEQIYKNGILVSSIYTDGTMQLGDQQVVTATTLPTAADIGKFLAASAENTASWTEVYGVGISTSETAVSDISSDEKLVTPAAVKLLIDTFLPEPVAFEKNSNLDMTERFFSKDVQYQVGDKCIKNVMVNGTPYTHLYKCTTEHIGAWNADNFNDLGLAFTPPEDLNIIAYLPAINYGTFKVISGNNIFVQIIGATITSSTRTVQVQYISSKGGHGLGILSDLSTGSVTGVIYSPFGISST